MHIYTCWASTQGGRLTLAPLVEPQGSTTPSVVYASWGRRFAAITLDYLVVSVPIVLILEHSNTSSEVEGWILVLGWPVILLSYGAYFTGFHGGRRGQTPGKRFLGIAVRDENTFQRIGYAKAFGRLLATTALWSFLWIPGIFDALRPLWDSRKQSLHDKMVGTVVVRAQTPETPRTLVILFCQLLVAAALLVAAIGALAWGLPRLGSGSGPDRGPNADIHGVVGAWNDDPNRAEVAKFTNLECVVELSPADPTRAKITVVSSTGYWGQFILRYTYNSPTASRSGFHSWFVYDHIYGPLRKGHAYDTALRGMPWREFKAKSAVDCTMGSDGLISTSGSH